MHVRETADAINRDAAEWVVRVDRACDDPAIAAELAAWLAGDTRRQGAYLRAQAMWRHLDDVDEDVSETRRVPARRWIMTLGGGLAAAAMAGVFWLGGDGSRAYTTALGERTRTELTDGSVMVLNTASLSHVRMTPSRRLVDMERGEAWFHVAKDRSRPFVVSAGPIRVEAVGTAFAVRRRNGATDVTVTSGTVRAWSEATPTRFISLRAGHRVRLQDATGASNAAIRSDGVGQALAWSRGEIVLDGMTLAEAAAEFNRYNRHQVTVEESLANRKLVGWFQANDPESFARSAATMVGGHTEQDEATTRIVK
ncbi:MAG: FecR domain-containing protein [Pseudomonadota bacterium]